MRNSLFVSPLNASAMGVLLLMPFTACQAVLDDFTPYAYGKVLHDSNVFRVSGSDEAIALTGDNTKDDTITTLGAGLKSDLKLSRQHLLFDADLARVTYNTFGILDHTRAKGRAAWKWQVGNLWSGDLGYRYVRRMSSFYERSTPTKDMRTTRTTYFNAGYRLSPDLTLIGKAISEDTSFQERDRLDRVSTTGQFETQYRNTLNTRVGLRARYTQYDLKNEQLIAGVPVNNDFNETELSGVFYWEGSAKSSLEARLGYTMLRYDELSDRNFNGLTSRLTYFWAISGKTRLDLAIWRETSSLSREIITYVLSQGISLKPSWSVTRKVALQGELAYIQNDFQGENETRQTLGLQNRKDNTRRYSIGANWTPRNFMSLRVGYRVENRDSTIDSIDFDDKQVDAELRLTF